MTSSISSLPSLHKFIFTEPPMSSFSDDPTLEDMDNFAKTLQNIKSKNLRPDLLASIISHFASKWLPDLSATIPTPPTPSSTAAWTKKRDLIENLIGALPPEKESMPCDFLLRLLRIACMVGAGAGYLDDLERRVAGRLDQASLKEVMIPGFGHTCGTLLDVGLMVRMVRRFLEMEGSGAALVKVGRLVDLYLAEVALDGAFSLEEFEELAMAVPAHARSADDGLYRAVDTYIKAHPKITKKEKKSLMALINPRKLTPEAALHAIHNDRLPVRSIIQILFSEQSKLNQVPEWHNSSFNAARSPSLGLEAQPRCPSKREVQAQQLETRRLRDDVTRLQDQCRALEAHIDRPGLEKKKKGFFNWGNLLFRSSDGGEKWNDNSDVGIERRSPRTPMDGRRGKMAQKGTPRWRNSLS